MQRKVIASAVALGLSASLITIPAVNAAEVGKKGEGTFGEICLLRLTDAEQAYRDKVVGDNSLTTLFRDTAAAIEVVYPQVKAPADAFLNNPTVKAYLEAKQAKLEPAEGIADAYEALTEKESHRFPEKSELAFAYIAYLESRLGAAYPSPGDLGDSKQFLTSRVVASDDPYKASSFFDLLDEDEEDMPIPANKIAALQAAFEKTPYGRMLRVIERDFGSAMTAAQKACLAGGDRTIAFPTKPSKPKLDDKTKPGDNNPGDNDKDAGSSDAGKIVGIIAGVLAALGLIAAGIVSFAPQLGIKLPF
ncbi:hypothetical protein HMPREF2656_07725 [Corynebacterium sp. HMSC034B08]|uniref:hypothetical protein n=1 Tax=Corynebacterium sp. HMSC034B08 TaxID=1715135 RepID=UPI0008A844B6|nr:hypothetical protein [Corynebacterium sp. HMSC034B08]OHO32212.1 hypothetical protein HMPREF2656_07725 [Corynebacterium sp. HMSC034B08]